MKIQGAVAALAGLIAAVAQGRGSGPDVDGFKAYELPAYTIVTRDAGAARPLPRLAAQIDGALAKLLNRGVPKRTAPTWVVLVPEDLWQNYLRPGTGITGEFVPAKFANYVLIQSSRDDSAFARAFFHEYSHWFLHTQYGGIQPLWFAEGLAEFVESAEFRGKQGDVAWLGVARTYVGALGWIPVERVLQMDKNSREYRGLDTSAVFHRECWALVHRGFVAKPDFGRQMFAYLEAVNRLEPVEDAVQASFGTSIGDLDNTVHSYLWVGTTFLLPSNYKVMRLPVDPVPRIPLPDGRAMSEAQALELVADIMLASGFNSERLPEVAGALQRAAPDSPAARSLLMRIAARNGQDAMLEQLLANVDAPDADPMLLRGAGLALYERVGNPVREDFVNRSFELLDRALMSRPDDAEAAWAYSVLAAHLKRDLPTAERRITNMSTLLPFNPYLAQAAALVHKAAGNSEKMKAALQDTLNYSKTPEVTEWATKRLEAAAKH